MGVIIASTSSPQPFIGVPLRAASTPPGPHDELLRFDLEIVSACFRDGQLRASPPSYNPNRLPRTLLGGMLRVDHLRMGVCNRSGFLLPTLLHHSLLHP